jgi:hypothetical protein
VLGVNRTSFHDWERRPPSDHELYDAFLTDKIKQVHAASGGTYGSPRVHAEVRLEYGIQLGKKRVERLMAAAGLQGIPVPRKTRTTVRIAGVRVAPDLARTTSATSRRRGGPVAVAARSGTVSGSESTIPHARSRRTPSRPMRKRGTPRPQSWRSGSLIVRSPARIRQAGGTRLSEPVT